MSDTGTRMNDLATSFVTLSTATATDNQNALDVAHACRLLNDEYARLTVSGTVAKAGAGISVISSGSTLVQILPSGLLPSTKNASAGSP